MFDRLSEELKEARIKSGLSLSDLASKTRIDQKFLQAIDDGNFSFLPELYVKAFLREYARFAGLDEKVIVKKYQALKEGKIYQHPEPTDDKNILSKLSGSAAEIEEHNQSIRRAQSTQGNESSQKRPAVTSFNSIRDGNISDDRKKLNQKQMIILGSIAGVLILFAIIYFLFFRDTNEIIVPEKTYEEIIQENSNRYSDIEEKKPDGNYVNSGDSLRLVIKSADTSWVKLYIDNNKTQEFILFPNSQKLIAGGSSYRIILGNSKSIQLELNGQTLPFTSHGRAVNTIFIDSKGLQYLTSTPEEKKQVEVH